MALHRRRVSIARRFIGQRSRAGARAASVSIGWHGPGKETFATEHRELTAFAPRTPYDMPARNADRVRFPGAAHQGRGEARRRSATCRLPFSRRQEVSDRADKDRRKRRNTPRGPAYYLRPDGVGKPGETRNWEAAKASQQDQVNFPWKGMSFVVGVKRYTAAYLDMPTNPKESRFSERD